MSSYLAHKRKGFQGAAPLAFNGFGNASRNFGGSNEDIDMGDVLGSVFSGGAGEKFTIALWMKADVIEDAVLVNRFLTTGNNREFVFRLTATGELQMYMTSDGTPSNAFGRNTSTSGSITAATWFHVAVVYDQSATDEYVKLYIDGTEYNEAALVNAGTTGTFTSIKAGTATLRLGEYSFSAVQLNGKLADVRIYDADVGASVITGLSNGTDYQTNLVGWWLTDSDNVLDAAGTNHGTNYGTKYSYDNPSPPVEFGRASRDFNGSTDYVSIPSDAVINPNSTDSFSAFCWVKSTNTSNTQFIFSKQEASNDFRGWGLITISSQSGRFWFASQTTPTESMNIASLTSVLDGQWHHVGFTYDGSGNASGVTLYVDGLDDTGVIQSNNLGAGFNSTEDLNLGARQGTLFYDGKMADHRIYDTDLTASQVSDLYAGTDVQTNLVGHYLTDNDDVEDKAGTNDGTNFGSTYSYDNPPMDLVPSRQASRSFDGVDDYIDLGNIFSGDTVFSVSSWIKKDTTNASFGKGIISKFDSAVGMSWLLFTGETDVRFLIRQTNNTNIICTSTTDATVGEWFHVAATVDGSEIKIYVNGNLENTTTFNGINTSTTSVVIGAYSASSSSNFFQDGNIADVRIYDTDLTASQILAVYNGTTDRTNLVGQWLTNSDDVLDHAGTNDGTNFGSTYSTDSPS